RSDVLRQGRNRLENRRLCGQRLIVRCFGRGPAAGARNARHRSPSGAPPSSPMRDQVLLEARFLGVVGTEFVAKEQPARHPPRLQLTVHHRQGLVAEGATRRRIGAESIAERKSIQQKPFGVTWQNICSCVPMKMMPYPVGLPASDFI